MTVMVRTLDTDILIVGAGPAGVALASTLRSAYKVMLIDPVFAGAKTKPCGGLLSEAAQRSLASFGLSVPKEILVSPQCFSVRVVDLESRRQGLYPRSYTNLDRRLFDTWLRDTLLSADQSIAGRVIDVKEEDGSVLVTYKSVGLSGSEQNVERSLRTRYLVGADGGGSIVRRRLFPDRVPHLMTAMQAHYDLASIAPEYACFYDRRVTPAFGWSLVKDDHLIVGGAFLREHAGEAFTTFEANVFRHFGYKIGDRRFTEACPVAWGRASADVFLGSGRVMLIGEAAGLISPSSLEGISFALESGYLLAQSFLASQKRPDAYYQRAVVPLLRKLFVRRAKTTILGNRALRELVIRSGLDQVKPKDR